MVAAAEAVALTAADVAVTLRRVVAGGVVAIVLELVATTEEDATTLEFELGSEVADEAGAAEVTGMTDEFEL